MSKNVDHAYDFIRNLLRNRNSLELLDIRGQVHNPEFKPVEFDGIRKQAGLNSFTLSPNNGSRKPLRIEAQTPSGKCKHSQHERRSS